MPTLRIDAHQHFWNLARAEYPWLTPALSALYRSIEPPELEPQLRAANIARTVLVQAANSSADTAFMLEQAARYAWIGAVVGWVPLLDASEAARVLDETYLRHSKFRGVRHLIHDEPDPDWIVQPRALDGLRVLETRGLLYEIVAAFPRHLKHVPQLAENFPRLTFVIDHLAKPRIRMREFEPWAEQMRAAARHPNVCAKISGLATEADWATWTWRDLKLYIDFAISEFGASRVMWGSDWPVCTLATSYARWVEESQRALEEYGAADLEMIWGGTAARVYAIT
jgi:L-fuconolactonase